MKTYRVETFLEVWRPGYAEVLVKFTDTTGTLRQYTECLATEHNRNKLWHQCGGGSLRELDDTKFLVTTDDVHKRALIALCDEVRAEHHGGYWVSECDKPHTMVHTWFQDCTVGLVLSLRDKIRLGLITKAEANCALVHHNNTMIFYDEVPVETKELFDYMVKVGKFQYRRPDKDSPEVYCRTNSGAWLARMSKSDFSHLRYDSQQLTFFFR